MYYKGTKKACEAYNNQVTIGENYQLLTNEWASIIKNYNGRGFAILKHQNYSSSMTFVDRLPDNWSNNLEL
jgi:glutamine amidotransferase-like uncharacterized protein